MDLQRYCSVARFFRAAYAPAYLYHCSRFTPVFTLTGHTACIVLAAQLRLPNLLHVCCTAPGSEVKTWQERIFWRGKKYRTSNVRFRLATKLEGAGF